MKIGIQLCRYRLCWPESGQASQWLEHVIGHVLLSYLFLPMNHFVFACQLTLSWVFPVHMAKYENSIGSSHGEALPAASGYPLLPFGLTTHTQTNQAVAGRPSQMERSFQNCGLLGIKGYCNRHIFKSGCPLQKYLVTKLQILCFQWICYVKTIYCSFLLNLENLFAVPYYPTVLNISVIVLSQHPKWNGNIHIYSEALYF